MHFCQARRKGRRTLRDIVRERKWSVRVHYNVHFDVVLRVYVHGLAFRASGR